MGLLTAKPVLYVVNTDDPGLPRRISRAYSASRQAQVIALAVGTELELAQLGEDEAAELAAATGTRATSGARTRWCGRPMSCSTW